MTLGQACRTVQLTHWHDHLGWSYAQFYAGATSDGLAPRLAA